MQPVFNRPMLSGECQQLFGIGLQARQTGNGQHDFQGRFAVNGALVGEAAYLLRTRPGKRSGYICQRFDGARFKATMAFILCGGRLQIFLARYRLLRGKWARQRHPAAFVLAWAGYL